MRLLPYTNTKGVIIKTNIFVGGFTTFSDFVFWNLKSVLEKSKIWKKHIYGINTRKKSPFSNLSSFHRPTFYIISFWLGLVGYKAASPATKIGRSKWGTVTDKKHSYFSTFNFLICQMSKLCVVGEDHIREADFEVGVASANGRNSESDKRSGV